MSTTLDPLAKVGRDLRRRWRILIPILAAADALGGARVWFEFQLSGGPPPWFIPFLAVYVPAPLLVVFWILRWSNRRTMDFVRGLSGRVRDAGFGRRGLLLIFDNGLLLQIVNNQCSFWTFFASDGSALSPSIEDAGRWWRGLSWGRPKGSISHREGNLAGGQLDQIRTALGSRWAWLRKFEVRAGGVPGMAEATLAMMATLYVSHWADRTEALGNQLEGIAAFLKSSRTVEFPERRVRRGKGLPQTEDGTIQPR